MHSTKYNDYTDEQLVVQYKQTNDLTVLGVLYQRYTHLIMGTCMKYLQNSEKAKDASLQLFEKLITEVNKHDIKGFKPWLYAVVKNFCLMAIRSENQLEKHIGEYEKDVHSFMENSHELHLSDERELQLKNLEEAVKKLADEQRVCIDLFYLQQKCYQEIVDSTGYSMNQVKSFIQNGKRNLKIMLTSNER